MHADNFPACMDVRDSTASLGMLEHIDLYASTCRADRIKHGRSTICRYVLGLYTSQSNICEWLLMVALLFDRWSSIETSSGLLQEISGS